MREWQRCVICYRRGRLPNDLRAGIARPYVAFLATASKNYKKICKTA